MDFVSGNISQYLTISSNNDPTMSNINIIIEINSIYFIIHIGLIKSILTSNNNNSHFFRSDIVLYFLPFFDLLNHLFY